MIDVEPCGKMGVVTGGKSGLQASGGKESTKDFCSAAFVTLRYSPPRTLLLRAACGRRKPTL